MVAYPEAPWATNWRDMTRINSAGMGMAAESGALIDAHEAEIAQAVAAHPEVAGRSAMFITHLDATDLSTVNFYSAADARVQFFEDLGLMTPQSVGEASDGGSFFGSVSSERIDLFDDADVLVT